MRPRAGRRHQRLTWWWVSTAVVLLVGAGVLATFLSSRNLAAASSRGVEYLSYERSFQGTGDIQYVRFTVQDGCLLVAPADHSAPPVVAALPRSWSVDQDGITLAGGSRALWGDVVSASGALTVANEMDSTWLGQLLLGSSCVSTHGSYRAIIESAIALGPVDEADADRFGYATASVLSTVRAAPIDDAEQSVRLPLAENGYAATPPTTADEMRRYLDAYLETVPPEQRADGRSGINYLVAIGALREVWSLGSAAEQAALLVLLTADGVELESVGPDPVLDDRGRSGLLLQVYGAPDPRRNDTVLFDPASAKMLTHDRFDADATPGPDGVIGPVESVYWD